MFCTNCANKVKQTHKFCYSCGQEVDHMEKEGSQEQIPEMSIPLIQSQRNLWQRLFQRKLLQRVLLPITAAIALIFLITSISLAVQLSASGHEVDELRLDIEELILERDYFIDETFFYRRALENSFERIQHLEDAIALAYRYFDWPLIMEWPHRVIVQRGESLSMIVERVYGHTNAALVDAIVRYNNLPDANFLFPGQVLWFPEVP